MLNILSNLSNTHNLLLNSKSLDLPSLKLSVLMRVRDTVQEQLTGMEQSENMQAVESSQVRKNGFLVEELTDVWDQ